MTDDADIEGIQVRDRTYRAGERPTVQSAAVLSRRAIVAERFRQWDAFWWQWSAENADKLSRSPGPYVRDSQNVAVGWSVRRVLPGVEV